MDAAGLNWTLITIVGGFLLAAIIAYAMLRNRADPGSPSQTEEATRRVYEEEDREHHGESDNVP